jgi:hypothetical protein
MTDPKTLGDALQQAAKDGILALGNHSTGTITITCTDGSRLELHPGEWCEVAWGELGRFERIISGPHASAS